jgi:WD40 repeat protein
MAALIDGSPTHLDISSLRLAKVSPSGQFFATALGTQLTVRDVSSLEVKIEYTCLAPVDTLAWSPDSELVMVCVLSRASVLVWCPSQPEFRCKISEGVAGLVSTKWGPDSRHIVTFADFNLHATLWNLSNSQTLVVPKPKDPSTLVWSRDGTLLAVATREQSKDSLNIVDCASLKTRLTIPMATLDCAALEWGPSDGVIVVQDSCLRYDLLLYSPHSGDLLTRYSAYEQALGLKSLSWSPCGAYLALSSYDQSVRLLNTLTWQPAVQYEHTHPKLLPTTAKCPVVTLFQENSPSLHCDAAPLFSEVYDMDNFTVPVVTVDETALQPKVGVGICQWSSDGRFLATRNDNMPNLLWIWDVAVGSGLHSVILMNSPIRCVRWSPSEHLLVLATGGPAVYFWSPGNGVRASAVGKMGPSGVGTVTWTADGADFLAVSSTACCVVSRSRADEDP